MHLPLLPCNFLIPTSQSIISHCLDTGLGHIICFNLWLSRCDVSMSLQCDLLCFLQKKGMFHVRIMLSLKPSFIKVMEKTWTSPKRRSRLVQQSLAQISLTLANFSQFSSVTQLCLALCDPWTAVRQASLSITNSWSLVKLMSIESVMPSNHLILCRPLLLPPSIIPSIRVSSNESVLRIRWPKCWSCSFSISPSNEYSGLISFRMDWLDVLAVQWTLKSLLQHHSSKASILWHSAFFIVQLSYPYITTGKTKALTRCTFVGKVMSLLTYTSVNMYMWQCLFC